MWQAHGRPVSHKVPSQTSSVRISRSRSRSLAADALPSLGQVSRPTPPRSSHHGRGPQRLVRTQQISSTAPPQPAQPWLSDLLLLSGDEPSLPLPSVGSPVSSPARVFPTGTRPFSSSRLASGRHFLSSVDASGAVIVLGCQSHCLGTRGIFSSLCDRWLRWCFHHVGSLTLPLWFSSPTAWSISPITALWQPLLFKWPIGHQLSCSSVALLFPCPSAPQCS